MNYAADPNAPGGYSQTTTLSPAQQAILDAQQSTELGATNIAHDQLGRVSGALSTPLDTSGLPAMRYGHQYESAVNGLAPGQIASSFEGGKPLQYGFEGGQPLQYSFAGGQPLHYGFDQGQQVQGNIGPQDLAGAYQHMADASYGQAASRLDPQFSHDESSLRTRLANQGLSQNDDAYKNAMDTFNRGKNDAYNQANFSAQGQGLNAENTLFGQSATQGQFHNQAASQQYAQNQGAAQFANQTSGQDFSQNQARAQFANQTAGQDFSQNQARAQFGNQTSGQDFAQNQARAQFGNQAEQQRFGEQQSADALLLQAREAAAQQNNTARQQAVQEQAYVQNQPIDQLSALLGMGQVAMPQGVQYTPTQVQGTDVIGANALSVQAQQAAANRAAQSQSGLMNGLFSLGGAAMMMSDRRMKTNIRRIGTRPDGLGVYLYDKLGQPEIGVMAQEVAKVRPDAVMRHPKGYLTVNYMQLEAA